MLKLPLIRIKDLLFLCNLAMVFSLVSCQTPEKPGGQVVVENPSVASTLDSLNRSIEKDSLNPEYYYLRSRYHLEQGETNLALSDINKAIQIEADNADYFVALADIYLATNRVPNCLEALLRAREIDPENNQALLKLAEVYLILKDYENTFLYSGQALDLDKINPVAHFIRGFAYLELEDTALAVKNFQAAADQDQQYYEAYVELGILYSIAKSSLAIGYLQTATRIDPSREEAYYLLGMAYQDQENIPKALETYNQLLVINPEYKEALYNIGYINLVFINDFSTAANYFTRALTVDPKYVDAWFNRGYSYELAGDYENARKDYLKALEIVPNYERSITGLNRLDNLQ